MIVTEVKSCENNVLIEEAMKVCKNPPGTWEKYKNSPIDIIKMEYEEFIKAKDFQELSHLVAACLNYHK